MNFEMPYDFGDTVYPILWERRYLCNICKGEKAVAISGEIFKCPKCNGSGILTLPDYKWLVGFPFKVDNIQFKLAKIPLNDPLRYSKIHIELDNPNNRFTSTARESILLGDCFNSVAAAEKMVELLNKEKVSTSDRRDRIGTLGYDPWLDQVLEIFRKEGKL